MEQELRIRVKIDKQTGELSTINAELNKLGDSTQKTSNHTNKLKESTNALSGAFSALKGVVASYIGLETVKEYAKTSDAMALLEARIRLVSDASFSYSKTQRTLIDIANTGRTTFESTGQLYVRLNSPVKELGGNTQTTANIVDAFSKTLLVSGAATQESTSATLQYAQAMGAGVLQGDEFRAMAENAPRILKVVSESLGVSTGALKQMGSDGKLTAGIISGALLESMTALTAESKSIPDTVGGSITILKNETSKTVEEFEKATGTSNAFAKSILNLSDYIKKLPSDIKNASQELDEWIQQNQKGIYTLSALGSGALEFVGGALAKSAEGWKNIADWTMYGVEKAGEYFEIVNDDTLKYAENLKETNRQYKAQAEYAKELLRINDALNSPEISVEEKEKTTRQERQTEALKQYIEQMKKLGLTQEELNTLEIKQKELQDKLNSDADNMKKVSAAQQAKKDANKVSMAGIEAEISGLNKQYTIKKQIEDLSIETALRSGKISTVQAEYEKEANDIKSSILQNQNQINLLQEKSTKKLYEGTEAVKEEAKDRQVINGLLKDTELQTAKLTAAEEKKNATIKAGNEELKASIYALNLSETDKQYQDLSKSVADLIKEGKDLRLVGEYATIVADQIGRNDAYAHLQTELDIRTQMAEVSLYGTQRETAMEQIRHDGAMANLSRELEQNKLNADEYLKLLGIENQRHKQNADSFYQFMLASFDNINKALDENFFNAMTGKFKSWGSWVKDFFKSIGTSTAQGLSRTLAGSLTGSVQSGLVNVYQTYGGLSSGSSLVGETVSASDLSKIIGSNGTTVSDGVIKTAGGTTIDQATGQVKSQGNDVMSLVSTASSLKTAYGLITAGVSGSIITGFQTASGVLASMGMGGAATGLMSFGAGVANPFAYAGMSGLPTAMSIGSGLSAGLIGGAVGYGTGWLGDKIFGADTYASTTGLVGGALGGIGASLGLWGGPIGIIAGSVIGSVLGGLFGKTKVTGSANGIDIFGNATANNATGQYWAETYYKKKSWFSSKSWTDYWSQGFSDKEITAIKSTIGVYDYLLEKLGSYNDIVVAGGRFSSLQNFLDTNVTKAFLVSINPNNLDEIYQSWVDYAKSIDKTIAEALTTSVGKYVTYQRGYTEWKLGSGTTEQLKFTADYLQKDFEALASSMGASTVTVDNFLSMYDAAIKNNFTESTIEAWASLGDTLMKSTDATKKYKDAIDSLNKSTAYTLPTDMLLQNLGTSTTPVDLSALVSAQSSGNKNLTKMVSYLYEIIKTQQELLKVTKYGSNQGIPA